MTALPADLKRAKGAGRPRRKRPPALVAVPAALVAAAMVLPLAYLVLRASEAGWAEVAEVVFDASSLAVLARSVLLAGVVTGAAVGIVVPLAWLTARTDLPGRKVWAVLAALPLVVPSYVGGLVIVSMLGPRGVLQGALAPLGVERLPSIYGLPGAALALTLFTYPYVFLTARAALRGMDASYEEAARSLGSGCWATFFRITLPQLRPAIVAGALLVALYSLSDFGAVSLLHYDTFSAEIYIQYKSAFDRTPAAILALMLVVLVGAVLAVEHRTRGRAGYQGSSSGAARPVPLGRGRWRPWVSRGCPRSTGSRGRRSRSRSSPTPTCSSPREQRSGGWTPPTRRPRGVWAAGAGPHSSASRSRSSGPRSWRGPSSSRPTP